MRKILPVALLALLLPVAASAQLSIGGKIGLAIPAGDVTSGNSMSDWTSLAIPLELNLNAHLAPNVSLGVYGGYAFASPGSSIKDGCDFYGYDCSQHIWRLGVRGEVALGDVWAGGFVPYVGANLGGEWNVLQEDFSGGWIKETVSGWEFGLEAGADTRVSDGLIGGAFVNLAFGEYGTYKGKDSTGASISTDITNTATHMWITFGVRGRFEMGPAR